jgi:HEAT repeat protein
MFKYVIAGIAGVAAGMIIALRAPLDVEVEPQNPAPVQHQENHPRDTVDALIKGLRSPDPKARSIFHDNLLEETGMFFGFQPAAFLEEREEALRRWEDWWVVNREKTREQWLIDCLSLEEYKGKPLALKKLAAIGSRVSVPAVINVLADPRPELRAEAARTLGQLKAVKAADSLIRLLESDVDMKARRSAARALGRIGTKGALSALVKTANQEDALTKIEASSALLLRSPQLALPVLHSLLEDDNEQARQYAVSRIADLRKLESVPHLAAILGKKDPLSKRVQEVLQSIVGKNLGPDPGAWIKWYEEQKQQSGQNPM